MQTRECGRAQRPAGWRLIARPAVPLLRGAAVLGLVALNTSRASAQCPGRWVSDFGGGTSAQINALTLMPGGDLVAGGVFTTAGGVNAQHIARWNGSSWSGVGGGAFNPLLSLAVLANGDLIAGGGLLSLNPVTGAGDYIMRWNGSSWSNLGLGVRSTVYSLTLGPDGQLVAGGGFATAGGNDAFEIASWNGSDWAPFGDGMETPFGGTSGYVFATAVSASGGVYAGGAFFYAGDMPVNRIARWDGTSWWPLDVGISGTSGAAVFALAVLPNGDLVAGGTFTTAGNVAANNIARWDGASWSPLGEGVSNASGAASVNALVVMPNGDLIAGGWFTSAGGVSANAMARWDGSAWSALGGGLTGGAFNTIVKALVLMPNGDLVAAGGFTSAGGLPVQNIARWTAACSPFCDADFNHDGDSGTDADIEAFFACIAGNCCATCGSADFNGDGDVATDADIESFFRVLAGGPC